MPTKLKACLVGLALAAFGSVSFAQDIHILLRAKDDKTWFHLGEPITVEAACVNSATGRFLMPCDVVLTAEGSSIGSRLSADRIDQTTWLDAQAGALPPAPRAGCGTIDNRLPSAESKAPTWQEVTLGEPFPVYVGQYKIRADLAIDLEWAERLGEKKHSSSDEIEIGLDDNLAWKNHLVHFRACEYNDSLALIPDEDAVSALRKHLDACAETFDDKYAELLHKIVWLRMQVEQPTLYARMLELERSRPPLRSDEEADLQRQEVAQAQLSAANDANRIRQWFHRQYRGLLVETARQLVKQYKSHPEGKVGDVDFQDELEDSFGNWHDAAATLLGGADSYLSQEEVAGYLRQAGLSKKYIAGFLKGHKNNLPGELPSYQR
jgi:hypothetical protein